MPHHLKYFLLTGMSTCFLSYGMGKDRYQKALEEIQTTWPHVCVPTTPLERQKKLHTEQQKKAVLVKHESQLVDKLRTTPPKNLPLWLQKPIGAPRKSPHRQPQRPSASFNPPKPRGDSMITSPIFSSEVSLTPLPSDCPYLKLLADFAPLCEVILEEEHVFADMLVRFKKQRKT